jgi:hypothetical protein
MARKKKKGVDAGPSQAYLLSFGDTMTTLLAFFIVLNSLAEEQTGANLYAGTGSFMSAVNSFGLGGVMRDDLTSRSVSFSAANPKFMSESPDDSDAVAHGHGEDEDPNSLRVIDREAEQYERFINEMSRVSDVAEAPAITGETTFDFFEPLNHHAPYIPQQYMGVLAKAIPYLRRPGHRVELIVWATTPAESAWRRAIRQAGGVAQEIGQAARLQPDQMARLQAYGSTWIHSDVQRPALSIVVRRVAE